MNGLGALIQNENMKIYRRPRTWILAAILLAIVIAAGIIIHHVSPEVPSNQWRHKVQQQIDTTKKVPKSAKGIQAILGNTHVLQYDLNHNINPYEKNSWTFMGSMSLLTALVTLFVVIIAGDIVAGEFTWGSIKMLMVRPHPRWSILLSKYLASILFMVALMVEVLIASWLVGGLFFGFGGFDTVSVTSGVHGQIIVDKVSVQTMELYGLRILHVLLIMTIAFMISTIFRSSALAIGISIFVLFAVNVAGGIFTQYDWMKYLIFPNLALAQYLNQPTGMLKGMTLPFSLIVDLVYWLIFLIVTWWIFQKRDIAN